MSAEVFRPEILYSTTSLTQFLNGAEEIEEVIRSPASLANRWEITCLAELTEICHFVNCIVLTLLSYVVHGLCMTDLSKRLWVLSKHELDDATILTTQLIFQNTFLARSINHYRKDTPDIYLQPPMHLVLPGQPHLSYLKFFHTKGNCRGMCHWFIYLYFKTARQFTDSQQHLQAVGLQFASGAPRQASLLQALPLEMSSELLSLELDADYATIYSQNKTDEEIIRELQDLAPGEYGLYVGGHQVLFIKTADNQQFLFDPNRGVFQVDAKILFKKVMASYFDKHRSSQVDILVDRYRPL